LKTGLFIANRLTFGKGGNQSLSRPIIRISVTGIALSLAVMIISVTTVTGFKNEIRRKIIGFGAHIQIINYDSNNSFETEPVNRNPAFLPLIGTLPGIRHVQVLPPSPVSSKQKAISRVPSSKVSEAILTGNSFPRTSLKVICLP
jgi:lipoprotein-releasing system permease protein